MKKYILKLWFLSVNTYISSLNKNQCKNYIINRL